MLSDTNFWVRSKTPQRVERRGMRKALQEMKVTTEKEPFVTNAHARPLYMSISKSTVGKKESRKRTPTHSKRELSNAR